MIDDHELVKHVLLIQYLGAQAMSSDESEDEHRRTISYPRIYPCWRSQQLAAILWQADTVSEVIRSQPLGRRKKPGTQLRIRPHSSKYNETAPAPIGLPRNCYDPYWLAGLTEKTKKELKVQDVDYEFVEVETGATGSNNDGKQHMEVVAGEVQEANPQDVGSGTEKSIY